MFRQSHSLGVVAIKGGILQASLKIGTLLKRRASQIPPRQVTKDKTREEAKKRKPKGILSHMMTPIWFTFIAISSLQVIMAWEVLRNPDFSKVEETPPGWKNFRVALTNPRTWIAAVYMVSIPVVGLGFSNFNTVLEE